MNSLDSSSSIITWSSASMAAAALLSAYMLHKRQTAMCVAVAAEDEAASFHLPGGNELETAFRFAIEVGRVAFASSSGEKKGPTTNELQKVQTKVGMEGGGDPSSESTRSRTALGADVHDNWDARLDRVHCRTDVGAPLPLSTHDDSEDSCTSETSASTTSTQLVADDDDDNNDDCHSSAKVKFNTALNDVHEDLSRKDLEEADIWYTKKELRAMKDAAMEEACVLLEEKERSRYSYLGTVEHIAAICARDEVKLSFEERRKLQKWAARSIKYLGLEKWATVNSMPRSLACEVVLDNQEDGEFDSLEERQQYIREVSETISQQSRRTAQLLAEIRYASF